MKRKALLGVMLMLAVVSTGIFASQQSLEADGTPFEVWAVDQSGAAGQLYIYKGEELNDNAATAVPEALDLSLNVSDLCLSQTGSTPTRAHMLAFNPAQTHAILAYVATGHVVFLDAATRAPVGCIDVGAQAHAAVATPDGNHVLVANQNGKLLQRITTDYATNTFTLDSGATLDLATCTTPNGQPCQDLTLRPDNAPICPIIDATGRLAFVTLRGGGLLVVDVTTTPMSIIAEYDQATVAANGCGGIEQAGKMYLNAGGGTAGNPTQATLYAFTLSGYPASGFNPPNTPSPTLLYDKSGNHDAHGMLLNVAKEGRYLWATDRFANTVEVVDTKTDTLVNTFSLVSRHSSDPAPDLMAVAPDGGYAFVSLRGPCPLTANVASINNAVGATPGVGVIAIRRGGLAGKLVAVAPISNPSTPFTCATVGGAPTLTERADVHAIAVRLK
jgi:DNA-binding beta-propeller fold protein YncE